MVLKTWVSLKKAKHSALVGFTGLCWIVDELCQMLSHKCT